MTKGDHRVSTALWMMLPAARESQRMCVDNETERVIEWCPRSSCLRLSLSFRGKATCRKILTKSSDSARKKPRIEQCTPTFRRTSTRGIDDRTVIKRHLHIVQCY